MKKDRTVSPAVSALVAGRSLDEQIECVRKYGNHAITPILRTSLLKSLGIASPKPAAENVLIFGCYYPFMVPWVIGDFVRLLDRLGMEYTYLEDEYCCGLPMIGATSGAEQEKALQSGKEFMQMNCDLAKQKGVKNIVYYCIGCVQTAKHFFLGDARHLYYFELVLDRLEREKLRIAPAVMGYYEGCHRRAHSGLPPFDLGWKRCRQLLDNIKGLELVDLPNELCCVDHADGIVKAAEKQNLDTVLCSCNACYNRVNNAGQGKVQVKYFTELMLEALR